MSGKGEDIESRYQCLVGTRHYSSYWISVLCLHCLNHFKRSDKSLHVRKTIHSEALVYYI